MHRKGRRLPKPAGGMTVDSGAGYAEAAVEIRNWQSGSDKDVVAFLKRRAHVNITDVRVSGKVLHGKIQASEVPMMRKANGMIYCREKLDIVVHDGSVVDVLTTVLRSRYDPSTKLLNLSGLPMDQMIAERQFLQNEVTARKTFYAIVKLAGEEFKQVESVSLENNALLDVGCVSNLADTYPKLLNLSLANNNIQNITGLSAFRGKFPMLRELVLSGNPVAMMQQEVVEMFPKLVVLDGITVRTHTDSVVKLPTQFAPVFFENEAIQNIATNFLTSFLRLWDSDRKDLLQLYDDLSEFSLCYNSMMPRQAGATTSTSNPYFPFSRNLAKLTNNHSRSTRLRIGTSRIAEIFDKLPQTKHDLEKAGSFTIDAWHMEGVRAVGDTGVIIVVHGNFTELPKNSSRSFDRTLIIWQNPQGQMVVASDLLTIRPLNDQALLLMQQPALQHIPQHAPPPLLQPGVQQPSPAPNFGAPPMNTQIIGSLGQPGAPPNPVAPSSPEQVVQLLMQQTRLSLQYATVCAQQANYDLAQALALFNQSRGQLPPDAFV